MEKNNEQCLDDETISITIVQLPDSSILIESNYDIVDCIEDDSFDGDIVNLQSLFEENFEITNSENNDLSVETTEQIPSNSPENNENNRNEMAELIHKLRLKFGYESGEDECFPSNPLRMENSEYEDFLPFHTETRLGRVDWCQCGNCVEMTSEIESICCKEVDNAAQFMYEFDCITQHEFFSIFCQREDTVNVVSRIVGQILNTPQKKLNNRHQRQIAYRSFTAWVHGYLGKGNRRPIPSCVVDKVRNCFPDPDFQYTGFKKTKDQPAEFMALE